MFVVGNDMKKTVESLQFRLGTIETATNKFSDDNKLGEGGFHYNKNGHCAQ